MYGIDDGCDTTTLFSIIQYKMHLVNKDPDSNFHYPTN